MPNFITICSTDPAVDVSKSQIDAYWTTRQVKYLTFLPDKTPVAYHLRDIPRALVLKYIELAPDQTSKHVRAFECAIVAIENRYLPGGAQAKQTWEPEWMGKKTEVGALTNEELELIPTEDVLEIGSVAYERCFLRPGREVLFLPPATSRRSLERALSHLVVPQLREQYDSRSKHGAQLALQLDAVSELRTSADVQAKSGSPDAK